MAMPSLTADGDDETKAAPPAPSSSVSDAELAQAFRDLARGEQTAQALESNLTSLERKLDDLLASFDESERQKVEASNGETTPRNTDSKKS